MKIFLLILICIITLPIYAHSQTRQKLISEVTQMYTGTTSSNDGLIAGFSPWGLVAALIFSCIGFIAFVYGKKNQEYRPLMLGIALMIYPYFIRGTLLTILTGSALTAVLFLWKE